MSTFAHRLRARRDLRRRLDAEAAATLEAAERAYDIELRGAVRSATHAVLYRHRHDDVSTEVLVQPIYSMVDRGDVA